MISSIRCVFGRVRVVNVRARCPLQIPRLRDMAMDEIKELAGKMLENVNAALLAMHGAGPTSDDQLRGAMPHPELFDLTMEYMDEAGLVTWYEED